MPMGTFEHRKGVLYNNQVQIASPVGVGLTRRNIHQMIHSLISVKEVSVVCEFVRLRWRRLGNARNIGLDS